jgi:hypothetical protein
MMMRPGHLCHHRASNTLTPAAASKTKYTFVSTERNETMRTYLLEVVGHSCSLAHVYSFIGPLGLACF